MWSKTVQPHTAKISKRVVDAFPIPQAGETVLWDTEIKGFGVRVYATGRKVYILRYRRGQQQRTSTIGTHGSPWRPEQARTKAQLLLAEIITGGDPASDKKAERKAMTVGKLIDAYLSDGPATKPAKRASTWETDRSNLERHLRPLLGSRLADEVSKADAAKAIQAITDGKTDRTVNTGPRGVARISGGAGTARRTRITAAAMFAWGIEHELIKTNPFAAIKLAAAPLKERDLSPTELKAIWDALALHEAEHRINPTFADAIRLLMLTGARKSEILGLRWTEVDLGRRMLTLPPERTKAGGKTGERRIRLSSEAAAILARRHHTSDGEQVFPGLKGGQHATGVLRPFKRVCEAAGLKGVRIHDLRHSYASALVSNGVSLPIIAKALGHSGTRATERYAHLGDDPIQAAAAQVADLVFNATQPANAA
jgi:integrase